MPEPKLQHHREYDSDDRPITDLPRRVVRPTIEDPLEELARILGEGAYPARPEPAAEPGRRANASVRSMPQQFTALEAELFDELRASVTPDVQVRGTFERDVPVPIPQHPVDDRDIASLRIAGAPEPEPPRSAEGEAAQWSDFYAYDDGVAAGSYDPAFGHVDPQWAAYETDGHDDRAAGRPASPRATFDEFGRDEIAEAAREAAPQVAPEPRIMPHSHDEQRAAAHLPREESGRGLKIAIAAVALVLVGGGAFAAWKFTGASTSGEPRLIRADGKSLKSFPEPTKATATDNAPSLTPDNPKAPSKIVSLQEDPVDQVNGRTAEGKEVRLINPGAPRPASDVPHTVKTVVVRPDGSIVTDGASVRPGRSATPAPAAASGPTTASVPSAPALPPIAAEPPAPLPPPAAAPVEAAPTAGEPVADVPLPMPKPAPQARATPPAPTAAPAAAAPAAPVPPKVKTVTVTPITVARPPAQPAPAGGAPMALGPVAPRLAPTPAAPPAPPKAAAAAPVPIAPQASGASGEYMVQISASGSESEARNAFAAAQRRHSALAGRSVDIQRADLGSKGVFWRTRVSAGSRDQAAALCAQIRSQGGQCMVVHR